jgi:hypothetical protein
MRSQWAGLKYQVVPKRQVHWLMRRHRIRFGPTMAQGKSRREGEREREVAEVGAIYPTQLFVNMLIIKTNPKLKKTTQLMKA